MEVIVNQTSYKLPSADEWTVKSQLAFEQWDKENAPEIFKSITKLEEKERDGALEGATQSEFEDFVFWPLRQWGYFFSIDGEFNQVGDNILDMNKELATMLKGQWEKEFFSEPEKLVPGGTFWHNDKEYRIFSKDAGKASLREWLYGQQIQRSFKENPTAALPGILSQICRPRNVKAEDYTAKMMMDSAKSFQTISYYKAQQIAFFFINSVKNYLEILTSDQPSTRPQRRRAKRGRERLRNSKHKV